MKAICLVSSIVFAGCASSPPPPQPTPRQPSPARPKSAPAAKPKPPVRSGLRDRAAFAAAMAQVTAGATRADVIRLLGRPDDVRTLRDPGGINATRTVEIWRYGTAGHLTFPTLGRVHFMANGRVQYAFGGRGTAPPKTLMSERALRRLLRVLDRVPSYAAAQRYNPRHVIAAVNALQPLGKRKALAVIAEYLRVSSGLDDAGRGGVFLVLRALFQIPRPPGFQRAMMVGASVPRPPKDRRVLPRFPLVIVDGIPLLLVTGYMLAGLAEPPSWHVKYFRKVGVLRKHPLRPTDRLWQTADRLAGKPRTAFLQKTRASRAHILNQLVLLAETVLATRPDRFGARLGAGANLDARWRRLRARASAAIRWSATRQRYVFANGTSLTVAPRRRYRRELWHPAIAGASQAVVTLQRTDPRFVNVELRVTMPSNAPLPAMTLLVRAGGKRIARLRTGKPGSMTSSASWRAGSTSGIVINQQLTLPVGTAITLELRLPSGTQSSSPLTP